MSCSHIKKNIVINNKVGLEHLYIGRNAFSVILSNLISNAIKYNCDYGRIDIGIKENCFYIENTCQENHMELKRYKSWTWLIYRR